MFITYLKIAFRNFTKDRFYTTLNIVGLSVGIAVALLIALFIRHELSYDSFHSRADRIFRITSILDMGGRSSHLNSTFPALADALTSDIPEIETAVRVTPEDSKIFKSGEKIFSEDKVFYVDPKFLDVFDFSLLAGKRSTVLENPYTVVLTPSMAQKYFETENWSEVIGQSILIDNEPYQVTGVINEAPANSHIKYSALASLESIPAGRARHWDSMNLSTYVLLDKNADIHSAESKFEALFVKNMKGFERLKKEGLVIRLVPEALTDIHLKSNVQGNFEPSGSVTTNYIFGIVGLVVLLLASVNFINLVTARSANRAKEVGVRKVLGSSGTNLMRQFILECVVIVAISTLAALGIIELLRYPFTSIIGKEISFDILVEPTAAFYLLLFVLVLGVLAGSYPAFFLSSFQPGEVLKGKLRSGFRGSKLRDTLVVVQFVISITLITCTLIVQRQLDYMRSKKLGFDKENILIIDNGETLANQQTFLNTIKTLPAVKKVGASTHRPVGDYDGMFVTTQDHGDNRKLVSYSRVHHDFLEVINYEFVAGRNFSRDIQADSIAIVINERAAESLFHGDPIGRTIDNGYTYTVIGVVKDFNFESLKNDIRPLVFFLYPNQRFIHVKIDPSDYQKTIADIGAAWKSHNDKAPFSYSFLDTTYDNLYKQEVRLGSLFNIFTGLALTIACLGLIGLAAYTAQQRKKEISIRKILGASSMLIVGLLSIDFVKLILISFVVAAPAAYLLMKEWLKGFAYQIDIPIYLLFVGGLLVIVIAILVVSYQSVRASFVNPVESLKEE
ncbi:MAG TPA: ABC transporter permease [Chryseosolibacter sp.]|nr:ABC transporter permease [Chryseosolibacter sp.]